METKMITDEQRLVGATSRHGYAIPTYDDGYGPLWVHRNRLGISGIVRARTWEEAYEICEDEFFPEADETMEEIVKEYGFRREHKKQIHDPVAGWREVIKSDYPISEFAQIRWITQETPDDESWPENELFQEAFGFRPNGPRDKERDPIGHGIYSKDLNGDCLDRLTPELAKELGITLQIENEE